MVRRLYAACAYCCIDPSAAGTARPGRRAAAAGSGGSSASRARRAVGQRSLRPDAIVAARFVTAYADRHSSASTLTKTADQRIVTESAGRTRGSMLRHMAIESIHWGDVGDRSHHGDRGRLVAL